MCPDPMAGPSQSLKNTTVQFKRQSWEDEAEGKREDRRKREQPSARIYKSDQHQQNSLHINQPVANRMKYNERKVKATEIGDKTSAVSKGAKMLPHCGS